MWIGTFPDADFPEACSAHGQKTNPWLRLALHHSHLLLLLHCILSFSSPTLTSPSSVFFGTFPPFTWLVIRRNFQFSSPTRTNFQERPPLAFAVSGPVFELIRFFLSADRQSSRKLTFSRYFGMVIPRQTQPPAAVSPGTCKLALLMPWAKCNLYGPGE